VAYSIKAARLMRAVSPRGELGYYDTTYNSVNKIGTKCRSIFQRSFLSSVGSMGSSELAEAKVDVEG
jgi:hypothetical protein